MKNVLIIDDHVDMRKTTADFLTLLVDNIEIDEAEDGDQALLLIEKKKYDLIISDQNMPTLSGTELASILSKSGKFKTDKFLIITGVEIENINVSSELKIEVFDKAQLIEKVIPRINELLI
ncbi:response regulator [uncultured Roseivirga sp.]|uniref:response regulator n=1 Tax=uncultured Roseivirga sp. TaxID=543088 RepID=UPI0030D83D2E|tara:strand:+ start:2895 stop:3257 length:363 start_codon:yes stop_codon:yes gene_type:complete